MASASISIKVNAAALGRAVRPHVERLQNPERMFRAAVGIIRDSIAREFLNRAWFMPSGGSRAWAPKVMLPNTKNERGLISSGKYFAALMGRGSGSVVKYGPRSVSVGVSTAEFPYARYIRGGTGGRISTAPIFIKPKKLARGASAAGSSVSRWALWWWFGLTHGVWLSESKLREGIKLVPRPHATSNPELTRRLAAMARRYVATGKAA